MEFQPCDDSRITGTDSSQVEMVSSNHRHLCRRRSSRTTQAARPLVIPSSVSSDDDNGSFSSHDDHDDDDDFQGDEAEHTYQYQYQCTATPKSRPFKRARRGSVTSTEATAAVATASPGSYTDTIRPVARGGVTCPFPWKLHDMLHYASEHDLAHVITWNVSGTAFGVLDSQLFVSTIMPLFFAQSKYTSFQRQLNLYGFERVSGLRPKRIVNGDDNDSSSSSSPMSYYQHAQFQRERPQLAVRMIRTKVKGIAMGSTQGEDKCHTEQATVLTPHNQNCRTRKTQSQRLGRKGRLSLPLNHLAGSTVVPVTAVPLRRSVSSQSATATMVAPIPPWQRDDPLIQTEDDTLAMMYDASPDGFSHSGANNIIPATTTGTLLEGDLLFFEGSPFHYLDTILPTEIGERTTSLKPLLTVNLASVATSTWPLFPTLAGTVHDAP